MRVRRVLVLLLFLALAGLAGWGVALLVAPPTGGVVEDRAREPESGDAGVRLEGAGRPVFEDEPVLDPWSVITERTLDVEIVTATGRAPGGTEIEAYSIPQDGSRPRRLARVCCSGIGETSLAVPRTGSVRLVARARGHVAFPSEQVVPPGTDRVRVEFVKACWLKVEVAEAGTGKLPFAPVTVAVTDLSTGRPAPTSPEDARTDYETARRSRVLPPGVYAIRVAAEGYRTWRASEVRLSVPGEHRELAAALEPHPDAGTLVLQVHRPRAPDMIQSYCVLARRDGAWRRLRTREEHWGRGHLVLAPLPAGSWDLLVWDGCHRVGRTRAQVRGGQAQHVDVGVAPGLLVPVGKPTSTGAGVLFYSDEPSLAVSLRTSSGESLPLVWWDAHQPPAPGRSHVFGGRATHGPSAPAPGKLGPYPFDEIVVEEPAADGEPRRRTVRAE